SASSARHRGRHSRLRPQAPARSAVPHLSLLRVRQPPALVPGDLENERLGAAGDLEARPSTPLRDQPAPPPPRFPPHPPAPPAPLVTGRARGARGCSKSSG